MGFIYALLSGGLQFIETDSDHRSRFFLKFIIAIFYNKSSMLNIADSLITVISLDSPKFQLCSRYPNSLYQYF